MKQNSISPLVPSADEKYNDNSNDSSLQYEHPPSRLLYPNNTHIAFQHAESIRSPSIVPNDHGNERGIPAHDINRQTTLVQSGNSLPSPSRLFMKVNDGYRSKLESSFSGKES